MSYRSFSSTAGLALAACVALACAADAAGSFDGTYRGSQHITQSNNTSLCNSSNHDNVLLVVEDNHFTRHWGSADMGVDIGADGSFQQSISMDAGKGARRVVQISGKITGGNLEADMGTSTCAVHMSLKKS